MTIYGRYIKCGLCMYDHILPFPLWLHMPNLCQLFLPRGLVVLHVRILTQPQRQLLSGVQFHQRLQNLGVHVFRRFVRPHIFLPQNMSHANHPAPEFVCSVRLRRHMRALTHAQTPARTSRLAPLPASKAPSRLCRVLNSSFRAPATPLESLLLPLNRDGLQFEMPASQERSRSDEFPSRQVFGREVALV